MSLPNWKSIPVCIRRSRRKLYNLVATEFSLTSYESLDVSVRRSNRKLYNYVASQLNLNTWDELDVPLRRSTHLLYNYVKNCSSAQTLTVTVTDESSVAISGASVVIGETSKSTGDDGKATFQLEYGDYTATITKDGYQTVTENIAFRSNHKNFNITLEETGGSTKVTGIVKDTSNQIVTSGTVTLSNTPDDTDGDYVVYGSDELGNDGTFTLKEVESGTITEDDATITYGTYWIKVQGIDSFITKQITINSQNPNLSLTVYGGNDVLTLTVVDENEDPVSNAYVTDCDLIIDEENEKYWIGALALNDNTDSNGQITTHKGTFGEFLSSVNGNPVRFTVNEGDETVTITLTEQ